MYLSRSLSLLSMSSDRCKVITALCVSSSPKRIDVKFDSFILLNLIGYTPNTPHQLRCEAIEVHSGEPYFTATFLGAFLGALSLAD
jgi:hypothetical protein